MDLQMTEMSKALSSRDQDEKDHLPCLFSVREVTKRERFLLLEQDEDKGGTSSLSLLADRRPCHFNSELKLSYRRLFEAAKEGLMILDIDTGRINAVNSFLVKLLSFCSNEMVGKTVGELAPFKDIELNKALIERLQGEGHVRYEEHPCEGVAK